MEPSDESLGLLSRMSSKPGVQSTLVLSRADGAIVRSEGLLARRRRRLDSTGDAAFSSGQSTSSGRDSTISNGLGGAEPAEGEAGPVAGEEIARTVWRFVQATEGIVGEMDKEDELRLLRIRTKKNELVIIPS